MTVVVRRMVRHPDHRDCEHFSYLVPGPTGGWWGMRRADSVPLYVSALYGQGTPYEFEDRP